MRNFYDILGIPENASEAWITREYNKRLDGIQQDTTLNDKARERALRELNNAYETLASSAQRAAYDDQLHRERERREALQPRALLRRALWPLIILAVVGGIGSAFWFQHQQKIAETARIEQERIDAARRAEEATAEQARREALERNEAEARRQELEAKRLAAQEQRERELRSQAFVIDPEFVKRQTQERAEQARVQAELDERRRRIEGVRNDPVAQRNRQELDRQARFLEQMRQEEELAARKRSEAAQRANQPTAPKP
jgi:nitrate reductase NapE component